MWGQRRARAGTAGALCAAFGVFGAALAETPGKDGDLTVSGAATLNAYWPVTGGTQAGSDSVTLGGGTAAVSALTPGDLVLIYQAQGAEISDVNGPGYGAVTRLRAAGRYEFQTVASVSGSTVTFERSGGCAGLRFGYSASHAQLVRVPQYRALTVTGTGRVGALPWDGRIGGLAAVHVRDTLSLNGVLDVAGTGFRGGATDNETQAADGTTTTYRSTNPRDGAEKGESIAGFGADYPGGRYGRGAPANGGGGGVAHNAGGGGGANGDSGAGWAGQGIPDRSDPSWDAAWNLDPTLSATTVNAGGGRGGYTYARAGDALTLPPGQWGNDKRREVGGLGGRPVRFVGARRLYLGGGGGAGDGNNNAAGAGGRGGGLAIVFAGTVTGTGTIDARGGDGQDTSPNHNDAPGGGGGGGTVLVMADQVSGIGVQAGGGDGGSQLITNDENEGPGGGGGGGVVAVRGGFVASAAPGGANGITRSSSLTEFPPNGATRGGAGQPAASPPGFASFPLCQVTPATLDATKSVAPLVPGAYMLPGSEVVYTIDVTNAGAGPVDQDTISLIDALPQDIAFWSGDFGAAGSGPIDFEATAPSLACCTGPGEAAYRGGGSAAYTYTPNGGFDPDVSHVRIEPTGEMPGGATFTVRFRARVD